MASNKILFRCFIYTIIGLFITMMFTIIYVSVYGENIFGSYDYIDYFDGEPEDVFHITDDFGIGKIENADTKSIPDPILLWWYPFTNEHRTKKCGDVKCLVTNQREYLKHPNTKGILFYGTSWNSRDLPLPRAPHHEWVLVHEESPKNVYLYSHAPIMEMFNHTATFRRTSDLPLPTFWLKDRGYLETKKYLVSTPEKNAALRELALVNYVYSDCRVPSDRDHFVQLLGRHLAVDSYGTCQHNKDLLQHLRDPIQGMFHEDFILLLARYKFTIVAENGVCPDYMTEKLWRAFHAGTVPIIIGSPTVRDFLPDNHSAILVDDFRSSRELADLILRLNASDAEYNKYLQYKERGITNQYLLEELESRSLKGNTATWDWVSDSECLVCRRIHENQRRLAEGLEPIKHQASRDHYGCPRPMKFSGVEPHDLERVHDKYFSSQWSISKYEAESLRYFWDKDVFNFTQGELSAKFVELMGKGGL